MHISLCLLLSLSVFFLILWHNLIYLVSDTAPHSDVAADMLLIERAQHDWLLIGHYSRFGFNHPGPFFLYLRYLAEVLSGHAFPSPYSAHLLAIIAINSIFVGIAATTVAALLDTRRGTAVIVAATTVLVLLVQDNGVGILAHPWIPFQLVAPFLAFILLLAGTAQGRLWMLPAASLCGGALVHGYWPLVPFVGLPWLLALACGSIQYRRRDPRQAGLPAAPFAISAGIIALFVAPLLLDMVINPPGNLVMLWNVTRAITPANGASASEVAAFVLQFWKPALPAYSELAVSTVSPILWAAAVIGSAVMFRHREARAVVLYVVAVTALMTLLLALYAWRAPGPLYPFIAEFYLGAPLAVVAIAVAAGIKVAMRWASQSVGIVVAVFGIGLAFQGAFTTPNQHVAGIRELSDGVVKDLRARAGDAVRIKFEDHQHWVFVTGLLLDLERADIRACVEAPHLTVMFTPERVCTRSTPGQSYVLIASSACADKCIVRSESLGLGLATPAEVPPYLLGQLLDFSPDHDTSRPYRASGWSIPDLDGTFSNAPEAELILPVQLETNAPLQLQAQAWSFVAKELPRQEIEILVNGRFVTRWEFTLADARGERTATIPAEVARLQEPLSIVFRMPNATSPLSLGLSMDARQLGIGLQWLRLDAVAGG
ncbi:hypothetical protein [Geminicoccus flavidas]|uniref:hypothetical protein n=1 Tax=Geminicoccus flavidas TaxID=2506407 RepID=UPI00135782D4|nr:hypothetical protein [Geminicoccus flavidas]